MTAHLYCIRDLSDCPSPRVGVGQQQCNIRINVDGQGKTSSAAPYEGGDANFFQTIEVASAVLAVDLALAPPLIFSVHTQSATNSGKGMQMSSRSVLLLSRSLLPLTSGKTASASDSPMVALACVDLSILSSSSAAVIAAPGNGQPQVCAAQQWYPLEMADSDCVGRGGGGGGGGGDLAHEAAGGDEVRGAPLGGRDGCVTGPRILVSVQVHVGVCF